MKKNITILISLFILTIVKSQANSKNSIQSNDLLHNEKKEKLIAIKEETIINSDTYEAIIQDSIGNKLGTISYQKKGSQVGYKITPNEGIKLNHVKETTAMSSNVHGEVLTRITRGHEITNTSTGESLNIEIMIIQRKDKSIKGITQPLITKNNDVNEFPILPKLDSWVETKALITTKSLKKYVEQTKYIPNVFKKEVYSPVNNNYNLKKYQSIINHGAKQVREWLKYKNKKGSYQVKIDKYEQEIDRAKSKVYFLNMSESLEKHDRDPLLPSTSMLSSPVKTIEEENEKEKIIKQYDEFHDNFYLNLYTPSFSSKILNKKISFDTSDDDDWNALNIYQNTHGLKLKEDSTKSQRYSELNVSMNLIEIRQEVKNDHDRETLNNITSIAKSINLGIVKNFITTFELISSNLNFQNGLGASLINNLNPASSLYPINPNCEGDKMCELGSHIGDGLSLALASIEVIKGFSLISAGISGTVLSLTNPIATSTIAPLSITAAISGIAMAGHGTLTFSKSFKSMYDKIFTSKSNISSYKKSENIVNSIREALKSMPNLTIGFAKDTGHLPFRNMSRANHASKYLTRSGLLPNWSKKTHQLFKEMGEKVLENPLRTFDHKLGKTAVKGFHGKVQGKDVVFFVYKEGPYQAQIASTVIPNAQQALNWGIKQ